MGTTDATGTIVNHPLMRGTFNFRGKINHTTQNMNGVNINTGPAVLTARINPAQVLDGATGVPGVEVFVKEGSSYYSMGTTDAAGIIVNHPLMRGSLNFMGKINHTTQYKNGVNTNAAPATLDAKLKPVYLKDDLNNPLSGGDAYVKEGSSYYTIGTTQADGYTDVPIMDVTNNFKMIYSTVVAYKNGVSPVVTFTWDGATLKDQGFTPDQADDLYQCVSKPVRK